MIIEFFGMPGTGKTTTAHRLAAEQNFKIIEIKNKSELLFLNILFALSHPITTSRLFFFFIRHTTKKTFWYKWTNLFLHPNAKYQKAKSVPRALIDQGHYQTAISLFESKQDMQTLHTLASAMFKPDFIVLFSSNKENRTKRLQGRHYIVRERDGENAFEQQLAVMEHHFEYFVSNPRLLQTPYGMVVNDTSTENLYNKTLLLLQQHTI